MTKGKCIECGDSALESWEATNSSVVCDHKLKHQHLKQMCLVRCNTQLCCAVLGAKLSYIGNAKSASCFHVTQQKDQF